MQHISKRLTLQHSVTIPKRRRFTLWHFCVAHSCSTHYLEVHNSVERTKTLVRKLRVNLAPRWWYFVHASSSQAARYSINACMSKTLLSFLAPYLHRITRMYHKISIYAVHEAVVWRGVSYAHGAQRVMAGMAVPCAYETPHQTTELFKIIYSDFTIYSGDFVEI